MLVSRRINRERVVVLGWGRAILMQLAHPLVAAGVAEHSGFSGSRLARLQRLHATVGAMLELSFGDQAQRRRTSGRINAIHDRVHGRLAVTVGRYPAGTPYTATDPQLLRWVHATLLDSMPLAYERFVAPLTTEERQRYCVEAEEAAELLRIPPALRLRSAAEVAAVLDEALGTGMVAVGPQAKWVAGELLFPPLTDATRPVAWLTRLVTIGLLPPAFRSAYGFDWSSRQDRKLRIAIGAIRRLVKLLPPVARYWPTPPAP